MAIKIDKTELAQRINALEGLDNETKAQLLELLHDRKKYGLVWEEHPEDVEERLREELPVLVEDKSKAIISEDKDAPNHILIEGDNLEAIAALSYTHKNAIDIIYIDPPYNMGEKDFMYNDSYIEKDDAFKHSKWLCFMSKRLKIAKHLLSNEGVIFISIDDHEQAVLTMLCDEIFGPENFISNSFVLDNLKGKTNDNFITSVGSRLVIYAKSKGKLAEKGFLDVENIYGELVEKKYKEEDYYGFYNLITFKKTGQAKLREDRPFMFYPILENNGQLFAIQKSEFNLLYDKNAKQFDDTYLESLRTKYKDYNFILPTDEQGIYLRWTSGYETFIQRINSDIVYVNNSVMQKSRPSANEMTQIYASGTPKNFMYKPNYSMGTDDLKNVIGENDFPFPKPLQLIKDVQKLIPNREHTILDFFAGSGTTLHATMQLNAEDGGHRKCILVTNNENNICEEVTYERNKRVINGYTTPKGEAIEGLHKNTLRYYRTGFVARESSATAKRELMYASADMLCIKNDVYTEQKQFGSLRLRKDVVRYFADGDKQMLIIYNPDAIETIVAELKTMEVKTPIIIYIFSLNDYAMDADFEEVTNKVKLCALPAAILNAYYKVLPKRKRKENTL